MSLLRRLAKMWNRSCAGNNRFFSCNLSNGLLTHIPEKERFSSQDIQEKLISIQHGLKNNTISTPDAKQKLSIDAERLSQSEFGQFITSNRTLIT